MKPAMLGPVSSPRCGGQPFHHPPALGMRTETTQQAARRSDLHEVGGHRTFPAIAAPSRRRRRPRHVCRGGSLATFEQRHVVGLEAMYQFGDRHRSSRAHRGRAERRARPSSTASSSLGGGRRASPGRSEDLAIAGMPAAQAPREQDLFRGNHLRWARPEGLSAAAGANGERGSPFCLVCETDVKPAFVGPASAAVYERDCDASLSW